MSTTSPKDPLNTYVRQVCIQCGHAFVWHGIGASTSNHPELDVPEGCGVRGCTCNRVDPEEG
jgi:hypothetical protein